MGRELTLPRPVLSDGFYPPDDGDETAQVVKNCQKLFAVQPRPFWLTTSFGRGSDYATFLSNVIFSENKKDPWHVGTASIPPVAGVNGTVHRFVAVGGAHHQDLRFSSPEDAPDVQSARAFELATVRTWLGL